jgi:uncharacterized membrane protein
MPGWIPVKSALVLITGVLEVGTGILILPRSTRRWAALSSLGLLVLLLPAMVHILISDSALSGPPAYQTAFRVVLMPNNILLAICSAYLWFRPGPSRSDAVAVDQPRKMI